jgi:hypothetical protein
MPVVDGLTSYRIPSATGILLINPANARVCVVEHRVRSVSNGVVNVMQPHYLVVCSAVDSSAVVCGYTPDVVAPARRRIDRTSILEEDCRYLHEWHQRERGPDDRVGRTEVDALAADRDPVCEVHKDVIEDPLDLCWTF